MDIPPWQFDQKLLAEYSGTKLLVTSVVFCPIVTLFVGLRLYARSTQKSKQGWDDYLLYPAFISTIANNALCAAIVVNGGAGRHSSYWAFHGRHTVKVYAIILYCIEMTYVLSCALNKLVIVAFYLRLFTAKWQRWTAYGVAGILVVGWIVGWILSSAQCIPFSSIWLKLQPGHCIDVVAFYRGLSIPNLVTDVIMLVLPLPMVWGLHTTRWQKIGLTGVFLTGSLGFLAALLRFTYFLKGSPLLDPMWDAVPLLCWTVVEPSIYLIAACLPFMRPLLTNLFQRFGSYLATSRGTQSREQLESRAGSTHSRPDQRVVVTTKFEAREWYDRSPSRDDELIFGTRTSIVAKDLELQRMERGWGSPSTSIFSSTKKSSRFW